MRKQTRRSIGVSNILYERMSLLCEAEGSSLSSLVERVVAAQLGGECSPPKTAKVGRKISPPSPVEEVVAVQLEEPSPIEKVDPTSSPVGEVVVAQLEEPSPIEKVDSTSSPVEEVVAVQLEEPSPKIEKVDLISSPAEEVVAVQLEGPSPKIEKVDLDTQSRPKRVRAKKTPDKQVASDETLAVQETTEIPLSQEAIDLLLLEREPRRPPPKRPAADTTLMPKPPEQNQHLGSYIPPILLF